MSARGGVVAWLAVSAVAMSVTVAGAVTLGGVRGDVAALAPDEGACAVEAVDEAAAELLAVECGHDVEVVSARTEWNSLYAQPDGAMRFEVSAAAVRTKVTGQWGAVDNSLVEVDGGYEVAAAVTPMRFGGAGDDAPLVQMWRDGHELTMDLPFDLPQPTLTQDDQLTYAQVLPGVDLIVTVNPDATGFSEVLRVQSPQAAADPRLRELVLPVETSSGLTLEAHQGGFAAMDSTGEPVFRAPVPRMWDSRTAQGAASVLRQAPRGVVSIDDAGSGPATQAFGDRQDRAVAPSDTEAVADMVVTVAREAVTVHPDAVMLADPATVWPVYIDPSIDGSRNQWTAVRDVFPQKYNFTGDEGVGLCSNTALGCTKVFRSRLLWTFTGLGTIGGLTSNQIVSATFRAFGTH